MKNRSVRVRLYELLLEHIGPFNRNDFTPSGGTEAVTASYDPDVMYERIRETLEKEERVSPKAATLANEVAWCVDTQRGSSLQRQNRLAAYEAGWMTMDDILFLERMALVLAGISPVVERDIERIATYWDDETAAGMSDNDVREAVGYDLEQLEYTPDQVEVIVPRILRRMGRG